MLDHAPVALRHPTLAATHRIGAAAVAGFRQALDALAFVEIHTPKIVGTATESGANVFQLDYFGRPAYLAQSPQLYKQIMVGVFERVYEVGPVFRAEPSDTARHLASTRRSTPSWVSSTTTGKSWRPAGPRSPGCWTAWQHGPPRRSTCSACAMPTLPAEVPIVHFADALEMISNGAPART